MEQLAFAAIIFIVILILFEMYKCYGWNYDQTTSVSKKKGSCQMKSKSKANNAYSKKFENQLAASMRDASGRSEYFSTNPPAHARRSDAEKFVGLNSSMGDNEERIKKIALEDSVQESHNEFINDTLRRTSTPSAMTDTDHDNGPVKRWGLTSVRYHDVVPLSDARRSPTEYPDELITSKIISWN